MKVILSGEKCLSSGREVEDKRKNGYSTRHTCSMCTLREGILHQFIRLVEIKPLPTPTKSPLVSIAYSKVSPSSIGRGRVCWGYIPNASKAEGDLICVHEDALHFIDRLDSLNSSIHDKAYRGGISLGYAEGSNFLTRLTTGEATVGDFNSYDPLKNKSLWYAWDGKL